MVTGCTAFSRPRARMASRRDAGCIASNGRRRPGASKTRPFLVDPGGAIAASRRLDDAPASPAPPLLALAPPGSMQLMTITRTGSWVREFVRTDRIARGDRWVPTRWNRDGAVARRQRYRDRADMIVYASPCPKTDHRARPISVEPLGSNCSCLMIDSTNAPDQGKTPGVLGTWARRNGSAKNFAGVVVGHDGTYNAGDRITPGTETAAAIA